VLELFVQEQKNIEAGLVTKSNYNMKNKEEKTAGHRRRFSSCASIEELDPSNPLTQLIEDLALDGADVDLALLKTAFGMIGLEPNEEDMDFIVMYLCTDDSGFVDFRHFLQFVQENCEQATPIMDENDNENENEASNGFDLVKAISDVANQLRIYVRDENRRKEQEEKIKQRFVKQEKLHAKDKEKK